MEEFVREKIKDKPLNKKKIATKLGLSALGGFIFALVACLTIAVLWPVVTGEKDDTEKEETVTVGPGSIQIESQNYEQNTQNSEAGNKPQDGAQTGFSLEDYQKIQSQLYAIANTVNKSNVAITSVSSDTDWFNNSYET